MKRFLSRGILAAATCLAPLSLVLIAVPSAALAADPVRPEVGKPLQEAAAPIKAGKYREALARVTEAEAVGGKTPTETYLVERMRFSAAQGAGDTGAAAAAIDAMAATGRSPPAERLPMTFAIATDYYRAKDYPHALTWLDRYRKEGGTDPAARTLIIQSYYLNHDCVSVARELQPAADAGRASEEDLQLLASCYQQSGDKNGYANVLERLVTSYPKKEYWSDLLTRTQGRKGFADRLDLDLYRLRFLTGNLATGNDFMDMGQLAIASGSPYEAKKVVDQGFATNVFGTGPATERPKRLQDLINKQIADSKATAASRDADAAAAKEGDLMVDLGFAKVTAGNFDAGIAQMEAGIAKDSLKRPDDARLHLGEAYIMAGKKPKGRDILRTVKGTDGTQDVARLWLIYSGTAT
jgi:hypothetical protein